MSLQYRSIARVVKTHGKQGEVVTVPVHGLPPLLHENMTVSVVPPDLKGPRELTVVESDEGKAGQLVAFSGVDSLGAAAKLVGKTLLAHVRDLPENFELMDIDLMVGRRVSDAALGSLGCIEDVLVGPANDVWVVRGAYGEVLVPAVADLVVSTEGEAIVVDLPAGLVDVEASNDAH